MVCGVFACSWEEAKLQARRKFFPFSLFPTPPPFSPFSPSIPPLLYSPLPFLSLIWIIRASVTMESPDLADLAQHYLSIIAQYCHNSAPNALCICQMASLWGEKEVNVYCGWVKCPQGLMFRTRKGVALRSGHLPSLPLGLGTSPALLSDSSVPGTSLVELLLSLPHISHGYQALLHSSSQKAPPCSFCTFVWFCSPKLRNIKV